MNKLESVLQEIKTSVFLFEEIVQMEPSEEKAFQLLTIYLMVASQIKEATELISTGQVYYRKHDTLIKLLTKNIPNVSELRALFIAIDNKVTVKSMLSIDQKTQNALFLLLSKEALDVIGNLDPQKDFGPEEDFFLPVNQLLVDKKEKQFKAKLKGIVLSLQAMVEPKENRKKKIQELKAKISKLNELKTKFKNPSRKKEK